MALNNIKIRNTLTASILLVILASLLFNPISALAMGDGAIVLPGFTDFSQAVQDGKADSLRGVYVSNVLALPIVQQPWGNAGYVSNTGGEATQFRMASQFGNVGLLAHNHLSGEAFFGLAVGHEIRLVYGDGRVETFVVTDVLRYQALQPTSPYSSFRNLDGEGDVLSAEQMFKRVYFGDRHVTFQTCIEADGNLSWGRLFVIAVPKSDFLIGLPEKQQNW
jgi:hypothetical protein